MTSKRKQIAVFSDETAAAVKVESSPVKRQPRRAASSKTSTAPSDGNPSSVETAKRKRDGATVDAASTRRTTKRQAKQAAAIRTPSVDSAPQQRSPLSPPGACRESQQQQERISPHHHPVETVAEDKPHADPLPGDTAIPSDYFTKPTLLSNRYIPQRLLGTGTYSAAYLALDHQSSSRHGAPSPTKYVAIKRMASKDYNTLGMTEFKILQFLHSHSPPPTHIVTPLNRFFDSTGTLHLVLEPLNSSTPISVQPCTCKTQHSHYFCPLRLNTLRKLALQLHLALYELHKHGFIHADLKPSNVLYTHPAIDSETISVSSSPSTSEPSSTQLKLIDLGNLIPPERRTLYTSDYNLCSASYRPPEILLGAGPISRKIDIWSSGLILLEWYLGSEGIIELAEWLVERALPGEGDVVRERFSGGAAGTGLMDLRGGTREELVDHLVLLFGSVGCYREGMFYESWYDEICLERVLDPVSNRSVIVEKAGAIWAFLEEKVTGSSEGAETVRFLRQLLEADVERRMDVQEVLRDPWLVVGLLGEWADLLLGDREVRGAVMREETAAAQTTVERGQSMRASMRPPEPAERPETRDGEVLPTLKSSQEEILVRDEVEEVRAEETPRKKVVSEGNGMMTSDDGLARLELL